jgi:hypothetical protein
VLDCGFVTAVLNFRDIIDTQVSRTANLGSEKYNAYFCVKIDTPKSTSTGCCVMGRGGGGSQDLVHLIAF